MKNNRLIKLFTVASLLLGASFSLSTIFIHETNNELNNNIVETNAATTSSYTGSYYDNLDTSGTGLTFRSKLANLITTTHKNNPSYDGLKNIFPNSDKDPNNSSKIKWFYTGTSVSFSSFGGNTGGTNREHVWPKDGGDAFPAESGPGSDAHHLRPTECNLNSTRGSLNFDEVSQSSSNIVAQGSSSSYGTAPDGLCYKSGSYFYPAKGYRGATARILMYVQTRWGDQHNLSFVDSAGSCKTIGKISTLLKWHIQEPPTAEEYIRNEAVYQYQGNRNPFIDHPEYASKIYCFDGKSYNQALQNVVATYGDYGEVEVTSLTINPNGITIEAGTTRQYSISSITPANASKAVTWSSSNEGVATIDSNGLLTGIGAGKTTITATSKVTPSVKATAILTVTAAKVLDRIEVSGEPNQTSYYEGDIFNPEGLTVTAYYTDGTSNEVGLNSCAYTDGVTNSEYLSEGTTSIRITYGGKSTTYEGINVFAKQVVSTGEYTLVEDQSDLVVGSKVIIANNTHNAAAGEMNSKYLTKVSATITNKVLESDDALEFTLGKEGSYYTFDYNGKKLCSSGKDLFFDSGNSTWALTVNNDGTTSMKSSSDNKPLAYNVSSPRFKTYDSISSSLIGISLYISNPTSSYSTLDEVVEALKMDQYNGEISRPSGNCSVDFAIARNLVLNLSATDLNTFKTSSTYADALARYLAWADALNENPWGFAPLSNIINLNNEANTFNLNILFIVFGITLISSVFIIVVIKIKHN